jgi:glycosyltransferase involved in cell wall biosynthesis
VPIPVDVVLPCLDEAGALPGVIATLPRGYRAIVVDNGSTDGSAEVAEAAGATVIRETRRGYGAAVHAGLLAATADVVAVLDADGSLDPAVLPTAVDMLASSDLVLGRRRAESWRAWPPPQRVANALLAWRVRRRLGIAVHDVPPLRVFRREPMLRLGLTDRRSGYPLETLAAAARAGWRIAEFDVPYRPRIGRSKVSGDLRGAIVAVRDMSAQLRAAGA